MVLLDKATMAQKRLALAINNKYTEVPMWI